MFVRYSGLISRRLQHGRDPPRPAPRGCQRRGVDDVSGFERRGVVGREGVVAAGGRRDRVLPAQPPQVNRSRARPSPVPAEDHGSSREEQVISACPEVRTGIDLGPDGPRSNIGGRAGWPAPRTACRRFDIVTMPSGSADSRHSACDAPFRLRCLRACASDPEHGPNPDTPLLPMGSSRFSILTPNCLRVECARRAVRRRAQPFATAPGCRSRRWPAAPSRTVPPSLSD